MTVSKSWILKVYIKKLKFGFLFFFDIREHTVGGVDAHSSLYVRLLRLSQTRTTIVRLHGEATLSRL